MINYDKDNIFSKILANEMPAIRVFEDSSNLVIMDAYPEQPGHMLAIPKAKSRNIYDITERDLEGLCILVKKIADMQKIAFGAAGVKIIHIQVMTWISSIWDTLHPHNTQVAIDMCIHLYCFVSLKPFLQCFLSTIH